MSNDAIEVITTAESIWVAVEPAPIEIEIEAIALNDAAAAAASAAAAAASASEIGDFALFARIGIFIDQSPLAGEEVFRYVFADSVDFAASLSGSVSKAAVAATSEAVFSVKKNGSEFGTITYAAAGDTGTFAGTATNFASGDILSVEAPNPADDTLADISITLAGIRDIS